VYVSPINIDPLEPTLPIGSPSNYSREIAQAAGRFYTQGFPADQKALAMGVLSDEEYFQQANIVIDENFKIPRLSALAVQRRFLLLLLLVHRPELPHVSGASVIRSIPSTSPMRLEFLKNSVKSLYQRMDEALKLVLSKVDANTTFFILSDHGFGTFEREFHLSRWLVQEGFTVLKDPSSKEAGDLLRSSRLVKVQSIRAGDQRHLPEHEGS